MHRDLDLERGLLMEAGRGVVDATELANLAQARAHKLGHSYVDDPMTINVGLQRMREATEEVADCCNHVLFWWQTEDLCDEEQRELLMVLRHLTIVYDILKRHSP